MCETSLLYDCWILEGVDGTGKTTLGNKLLKTQRFSKLHHFGAAVQSDIEFYRRMFIHPSHQSRTIYDRHPAISERVYGPVMRNSAVLSLEESISILKKFNPFVIYCHTKKPQPQSKLYKTREQLDELRASREILENEYSYLMNQIKQKGISVIMVDPFNESQVKELMRCAVCY